MTKRVTDGNAYYRFLKAEDRLVSKIANASRTLRNNTLASGQEYPLFKSVRVRQDVIRRRVVVG